MYLRTLLPLLSNAFFATAIPQVFPTGFPTGVPLGVPTGLPSGVSTGVSLSLPTGFPPGVSTGVPTDFLSGVSTGLPTFLPTDQIGSIVSTALAVASAPIPTAVTPVIASAVAAVPSVPNNATTDSLPGLNIPPFELYDNILAAIAILDVVLTLLNASGLAVLGGYSKKDLEGLQSLKERDLEVLQGLLKERDVDLPVEGLDGLVSLSIEGNLGYTIETLLELTIPLLAQGEYAQ